jgi:hypothetical protein
MRPSLCNVKKHAHVAPSGPSASSCYQEALLFEGESHSNQVEKKCQAKHTLFRKKNHFFANNFFREKNIRKMRVKTGGLSPFLGRDQVFG